MASEHRSAHEFGDFAVTQSISQFKSQTTPSSTFSSSNGVVNGEEESANKSSNHCSSIDNHITVKRNQKSESSPSSSTCQDAIQRSFSHSENSVNIVAHSKSYMNKKSFTTKNPHELDSPRIRPVDSESDEEDGGKLVDVTKDIKAGGDLSMYSHIPHPPPNHPPPPPPTTSYLSEKDKFLMALGGDGGSSDENSTMHRSTPRSSRFSSVNSSTLNPHALKTDMKTSHAHHNYSSSQSPEKQTLTFAQPEHNQLSAKEKFERLLSGGGEGDEVGTTNSNAVELSQRVSSNPKDRFNATFGEMGKLTSNSLSTSMGGKALATHATHSKASAGIKADMIGQHLASRDKDM